MPSSSRTVTPSSRYSVISATWRSRCTVTPSFSSRRWNWLGGALVDAQQQPGQDLDHRDPRPQRGEEAGELAADHAAADDDHRLGDLLEHQDVVRGQDRRVVHVEARQARRLGADADDQVVEGVRLAVDHDGVALDPPLAAHDLDALALGGALDALAHAQDDLVLALHHLGEVERDLGHHQAVLVGAAHPAQQVGGREQRLRRDATPVHARPAELRALDQGRVGAELGRPQRGDVARGPSAQHDDARRGCAVTPAITHR